MSPESLKRTLRSLVAGDVRRSAMIWGPPGVGKSAVVRQVAEARGLPLVDLRISQLAPTDLRGLPVPDGDRCRWLAPEFLPRGGEGILFLDEINMAPPAVQGIAQQLVLDRRVGSYTLPEGWFVWAAGNRKDDRAAVFDMPAPLANRFLHLEVEPDIDAFRLYAARHDLNERVVAFLAFRPALLFQLDPRQPAWPSPRSWEMAAELLDLGLAPALAVGSAAAGELEGFCRVYDEVPDLDAILAGKGLSGKGRAARDPALRLPSEPSARYAVSFGLAQRASTAKQGLAGLMWMLSNAESEWVRLFCTQLLPRMRSKKQISAFLARAAKEPTVADALEEMRVLIQDEG